eukprot:CAMPEP_0119320514 /NCGR_PEP_ID=MMETSP1333-20130426/52684_1 /TAXON_ID=418940 /ORGANISM="Scyphosphaera apsteinii, Strain RCC1455" /LENGTH=424 /DNA_ID=CAMNT_0007327253 /DNA_START=169 /DNA_END=1443 /DNA_ORIENTATION=+
MSFEDEAQPLPTELDTASVPRYLVVTKDKLQVRYVGKANHFEDVGAIRSNWPCPQRCFLYYYEATVLDSGARGCLAIGLAEGGCQLNRPPGWESSSYAYHGSSGKKHFESEQGEPYGPGFVSGDVIGCGLLCLRREIFFTKNGQHLGVAFCNVSSDLYPTVGLHSPAEALALNFGAECFKFDVANFITTTRQAKLEQVSQLPIPISSMDQIVRRYLLHFTFKDTLAALDQKTPVPASHTEPLSVDADCLGGSLEHRRQLRQRVLDGDICGARELCDRCYPHAMERNPNVTFLLHTQAFIELIRAQQPLEAVTYAQTHLAQYRSHMEASFPGLLQDAVALLAYDDPIRDDVPIRYLMRQEQRELVADALNSAVLAECGEESTCALERMLRQLVAVHHTLRDSNLGFGDSFRLCEGVRLQNEGMRD